MLIAAAMICGFVFGWGLLISGMMQPAKVLAFLDILGPWDPSLAIVMAAALVISSAGFVLAKNAGTSFACGAVPVADQDGYRSSAGDRLSVVRHRVGPGRIVSGASIGKSSERVAARHCLRDRHGSGNGTQRLLAETPADHAAGRDAHRCR